MGFKMTVELDVDDNPDVVGEALRSRFFDEKGELGCYSAFDWQKDVRELPKVPVEKAFDDPLDLHWTRGELVKPGGVIECRYYWDGDGTLAFKLPDGRWLVNDDCKKAGGWDLLPEGAEV